MAFRVDIGDALRGLSEARMRTMFAVEKYGQAAAAQLEARAKSTAPWTDQTALARQTMAGVADWAGESFRIGLTGNMDYSVYLEYCNEGRYAILWPTLNEMTAEILQGMHELMK